jgi:hypothetical protein
VGISNGLDLLLLLEHHNHLLRLSILSISVPLLLVLFLLIGTCRPTVWLRLALLNDSFNTVLIQTLRILVIDTLFIGRSCSIGSGDLVWEASLAK